MFQHLNANASWLQVETARDLQTHPKVPTRSANIFFEWDGAIAGWVLRLHWMAYQTCTPTMWRLELQKKKSWHMHISCSWRVGFGSNAVRDWERSSSCQGIYIYMYIWPVPMQLCYVMLVSLCCSYATGSIIPCWQPGTPGTRSDQLQLPVCDSRPGSVWTGGCRQRSQPALWGEPLIVREKINGRKAVTV